MLPLSLLVPLSLHKEKRTGMGSSGRELLLHVVVWGVSKYAYSTGTVYIDCLCRERVTIMRANDAGSVCV